MNIKIKHAICVQNAPIIAKFQVGIAPTRSCLFPENIDTIKTFNVGRNIECTKCVLLFQKSIPFEARCNMNILDVFNMALTQANRAIEYSHEAEKINKENERFSSHEDHTECVRYGINTDEAQS